jgi:mannitol-1-phosphate 5-dehydrogenase
MSKKAVQFGAGNIGRGFLGQLFNQSGYEVVFVEVNERVISALNRKGCYNLEIVGDRPKKIVIDNVRAVHFNDTESITNEIKDADIVATAVGVSVLEKVAPIIAAGIKKRAESGAAEPINIIICENLLDAGKILKGYISKYLTNNKLRYLDTHVGFVESVVSRMIPVVPDEIRARDAVMIMVEEYGILPVSKKGFAGQIPEIKGIIPYDNLQAYEEQKLFIHNLGHATCAYLGYLKGYKFIWESILDSGIRKTVQLALNESGEALIKKHGFTRDDMKTHVEDLLTRFANRALGDTVHRVGREPIRKLGTNDRFTGAAKLCLEYKILPENIVSGIVACLKYDYPQDSQALELQSMLNTKGIQYVLNTVCKLDNKSKLSQMIMKKWRKHGKKD